jgi:hypothetical protein
MTHRHLEYPEDTPVEQRPLAAIVDTLERGDLGVWRPIAAAIVRDPFGEFAAKLTRLLDAYPMYGTTPLWRAWIDRCRARAEGSLEPSRPVGLAELRRRSGLTQVELAGRIGMSQSDLSKLERRPDVRLSSLRTYAAALGSRLRILFDHGRRSAEIRISPRGD